MRHRVAINRRGVVFGVGVLAVSPAAASPTAPVIAAAASLRPALDELAALFARPSGAKVRISYGATGSLVRQIEQGAPFEALLAADTESVARLTAAALTDGAMRVFARGRLALVVPLRSPVAMAAGFAGIEHALASGQIRKFAIANPVLAPYGRAALAVLDRAGLQAAIEPLLVRAENVGQAAQFVASGAAEAGLVAASLTRALPLSGALQTFLVQADWHPPLDQAMVAIRGAGAATRAFLDLVLAAAGREVLARHGFDLP